MDKTICFSSQELYCEHMGEELTFFISLQKKSRPCNYVDEDGETVYDFTCFVEAVAAYSIDNPKLVTVAERDKALLTSTENMRLSPCEIYMIEINGEVPSDYSPFLTISFTTIERENLKDFESI